MITHQFVQLQVVVVMSGSSGRIFNLLVNAATGHYWQNHPSTPSPGSESGARETGIRIVNYSKIKMKKTKSEKGLPLGLSNTEPLPGIAANIILILTCQNVAVHTRNIQLAQSTSVSLRL